MPGTGVLCTLWVVGRLPPGSSELAGDGKWNVEAEASVGCTEVPAPGRTSVGLSLQWKDNQVKAGRRSWGSGQLSDVLTTICCSPYLSMHPKIGMAEANCLHFKPCPSSWHPSVSP